jgi:hypothetical protein
VWEGAARGPTSPEQDLRLIRTLAILSDRTPAQVAWSVDERIGTTNSFDRVRAGERLPNAVRAELTEDLNERIRREKEIGTACVAASRDLTALIAGMSALVVLAVSLMVN